MATMAYSKQDAQAALDAFGATASATTAKHHEAGIKLLRELALLQKPAGLDLFNIDPKAGFLEVEVRRLGFRRVWFGADLHFKISEYNQENTTRDLDVKIEYDPVRDEFVGIEDEPEIVPVPGARRVKRDALAAVIDAIAKDMYRKR